MAPTTVSPSELSHAAELLRTGGLVAFPTETVYGLGANAFDGHAVGRIFAVKGRPATSPLIVHISGLDMVMQVAAEWPDLAAQLAAKFWPGPLTLVLAKQHRISLRVTAGLNTVALRVPAHPLALALLNQAAIPVAAPSANRFTGISPTTAQQVRDTLGGAIDMVLDGGPCLVGIESTVISLVDPARPVLLRPGMIARAELEAIAGPLGSVGETPHHQPQPSPGRHARHYSPRTPLILGLPPLPARAAFLCHTSAAPAAAVRRLPLDPAAYARELYHALYQLDSENWEAIYVEPLPDTPDWEALRDRLTRAASKVAPG